MNLSEDFETTQFVKLTPSVKKFLKKHFPNIPIHDDIRTFTARPFQYDVITGGFPCQDISVAGRREGITEESRSGLFYELMRIIRLVRPKFIVLENVATILNNGLDIVLGELSEAGYDAEWSIISASSLGACHRRSRWWLVAYPNNDGSFATEKSRSLEKTNGGAKERKNQAINIEEAVNPNTQKLFNSMLPTPTAMDTKEDALKHATKLLQGKTHRSSGQPIQVSLSDAIMMEKIRENPELMKVYQDHQMEERPFLPSQEEFVSYLRGQTTIKELTAKTKIKKTTIEHWFRKDKAGFSYPSIENWKEIKPHLKTIQFDKEMITTQTKEWTTKSPLLPTPTASDVEGGIAKDVQFKEGRFFRENKKGVRWGVKLRDALHSLPTPTARDYKGRSSVKWNREYGQRNIPDVLTQTGDHMSVNPYFLEEVMGYPMIRITRALGNSIVPAVIAIPLQRVHDLYFK